MSVKGKNCFSLPFLLISLLLSVQGAFSQSPLTDINFYTCYSDFPMVKEAHEKGIINQDIARELMKPDLASDVKAAIINALSFDILGKNNTPAYVEYLKSYHRFSHLGIFADSLSADELFCIAYLMVMDDYLNPEKSYIYFEKAIAKDSGSYTYQMIFALVKAQTLSLTDRCGAWDLVEAVLENKDLKDLMLPESIKMIREKMQVYHQFCP